MDKLQDFKEQFKKLSRKYYNDPVKFIRETFRVEPTEQQIAVLEALVKYKQVSARSGHGVGKSTLASWVIYWFLITRPYPRVICTAPTFHQLHDILWAEAASWRQKSELITNLFEWKQRRIEARWSPENWWAAARTAEKGESLTGRHAGHFMLIVDEASGIEDSIFEASEGMLTSENTYVLLLGNPTKNAGFFFNSHNKDAKLWSTHTLSCQGSPLVAEKYIENMKLKYGATSNNYKIRVLGEFPTDEQDTLIPHNWVVDAKDRAVGITNEPLFLGVDVGAGGALSAIVHRRGGRIEKVITHNSKDTMEITGWVALEAIESKADAVFIDSIGIGKGAFDRLRELNFKVYSVDVRSSARKEGFKKLRDELWWTLREQFEKGLISIPIDEELTRELSNIKYKPDSSGAIKIESKIEMRKRKMGSPDRADALMMTYYLDERIFTDESKSKYKFERDTHHETNEYGGFGWMGR